MNDTERRITRRLSWLTMILLCLFAAWNASSSYAQSDNGTIVGTVTDASGAIVPNVAITVTNLDTGLKPAAKSNDAGEFRINAVPRGNYQAQAEAQGFQTQTVKFQVLVATTQTLTFKMVPGEVS